MVRGWPGFSCGPRRLRRWSARVSEGAYQSFSDPVTRLVPALYDTLPHSQEQSTCA
jgi:hypothetical protein